MNILDAGFNHPVFSKNNDRLLKAHVSREFFGEIVEQARKCRLLSDECFSVDGTLLDASASMKSFRPKGEDGPPPRDGGRNHGVDFRGERRVNEAHGSRAYTGGSVARKGAGNEARLCYEAHVLMDNRQGVVVDVKITNATGTSERDAPWTCSRWCLGVAGPQ